MKFEQYAILSKQIEELQKEKDALKEEILKEMTSRGEEKVDTVFGKFSIAKLKKWEYPEYVKSLEEAYKVEMAKAQETGEATYTESPSLRFTKTVL